MFALARREVGSFAKGVKSVNGNLKVQDEALRSGKRPICSGLVEKIPLKRGTVFKLEQAKNAVALSTGNGAGYVFKVEDNHLELQKTDRFTKRSDGNKAKYILTSFFQVTNHLPESYRVFSLDSTVWYGKLFVYGWIERTTRGVLIDSGFGGVAWKNSSGIPIPDHLFKDQVDLECCFLIMQIAKEKGYKRLAVVLDYLLAVEWINKDRIKKVPVHNRAKVQSIWAMRKDFEDIQFIHAHRAANIPADLMTKEEYYSVRLTPNQFVRSRLDVPSDVLTAIDLDSKGEVYVQITYVGNNCNN